MRKPKDPRDLAVALLTRSVCSVQVAAVLADRWGIYGWGWNNSGADGMGEHAEASCCKRARNRSRNAAATLYVAAQRKRNEKAITALPCPACQQLLLSYNIHRVVWRDRDGSWRDHYMYG